MKKLLFISMFCLAYGVNCFAQNFTDSNLPIIIMTTNGKPIDSPYSPAYIIWMGVINNAVGRNHMSDSFTYTGLIKIKSHGNSTQWFPKKAWNVTTVNSSIKNLDTTLLGLPKEHDWVFKALYEDKTLLRDNLSFKIFQGMGNYCSHSRFFELVVDGNYRGVYQLEERIKRDKSRVNIAKLKPTDIAGDSISGGYIVSIDRLKAGDQGWKSNYPSNSANDSSNIYIYDYPKPDSMPQVQKDYIHHFFDKFENVMQSPYWNNLDSGYTKYINIKSFIDKFLIEELSRNTDGYRLKAYYYKDKNSRGDGKIHAGPIWDYAIGWGNCSFSGGDNPWWWQYTQNYNANYVSFWWKKIVSDTTFQNELRCRYDSLRTTVLSKNNLFGYIDSMVNYLSESQQRNFQRWPILGQNTWPEPQPVPADYMGEISHLKWWINERLNWLDIHIPGICTPIRTGVEENSNSLNINSFPNPFTNNFNITYKVPSASCTQGEAQVVIELFNIIGDRILLWFSDRAPGLYTDQLPSLQLTPGIYTMKFTINNETTITKKIIKTD
jgi:hypothetical protein